MKEGVAAQKSIHASNDFAQDKKSKPDLRADHVDEMRRKVSGLGSLRISPSVEPPLPNRAASFDEDFEVMTLSPAHMAGQSNARSKRYWVIYAAASIFSLVWFSFSVTYAFIHPETFTLAPADFGAFLGGVFAPCALFWVIASTMNRRADVEYYSRSLRGELHRLLFPDDASEHLINQDVQRLVQQASEISTASRAVLKSLQRARQGLRMEVRDYAGVSKKTEFHIDRLSETLNERSAKLLALTAEIEQRTAQIDSKTQAGAEAWDRATVKILERAGTIEATMGRGADKILSAADRADEKAQSIEEQMTKSYQKLSEVTDRFDAQAQELVAVENKVAEKSDSLGEIIKVKVKDLRGITDDALLAMSKSGDMIKEQKEAFDRSARVFADQARQIGEIVAGSVGGLNEAVDHVIAKGVSLEEKLGNRAQELRGYVGTLSKEAEAIERAGQNAASKLDETLALASAGSESIHASIRRSADMMDATVKNAQKNTCDLNEASEQASKALTLAVDSVEEKLRSAEMISTDSHTRLKDIATMVERQTDKLAETEGRYTELSKQVLERLNELTSAGEFSKTQVEQIRTDVTGQMEDISLLSEHIQMQSTQLNEALSIRKEELDQLTQASLTKIDELGQSIGQRTEDIDSAVRRAENRLKDIDATLETRISTLRGNADEAVRSIGDTTAALDISLLTLQAVESTSDSALAKLTQASTSLNEQLGSLKVDTNVLLEGLKATNIVLSSTTEEVGNASSVAYEKIVSLGEALGDRRSELQKLSDMLSTKVNSIQETIHEQLQDLTSSVGLAVAMIGEVGNEFTSQAKNAEETAERVAGSFERVGFVAREESEMLNKSSELAAQRATRQAALLRDELKSLLDNSGILGDIKTAGETLSQRAGEFAKKMQEALQTSQIFNTELKLQAINATEASRDTVQSLDRAVASLTEKTQEMGKAAEQVSQKIVRTQEDLKSESDRLVSVSSAALESARLATQGFGKQSESLFKAAQDAAQRVEDIRNLEGRAQRETFMDSAKFIMEKLHSLSVDLTRMVEGEVSEKSWKAYQAGDIGVFTRNLANLTGEVPMDRARAKFIKDSDFRSYVQRFIRQFEEMYLQAVEGDHAGILSAALASSDVGRLYVFLCAVAGTKTRLGGAALKAA